MNVAEYIASGILESYVTGAVTDQERREVDCLSSIYPEIRQELDNLSATFENYAQLHQATPPAFIKQKLLQQLDFSDGREPEDTDNQESTVLPMPTKNQLGGYTYRTTWAIAASVGLLLLVFSSYLVSKLWSNQKNLTALRNNNQSLQNQLHTLREHQMNTEQRLALLQQPGVRVIQLQNNEKAPAANLYVYWNTRTQQVSVDVKSLPPLPADRQYQLWSLVNGQPNDAGVFDNSTSAQAIQLLNRAVAKADAFAVTVEKRGGSPKPNLSALVAMTQIKS